jgi:hypothetical protein
MNGFHLHPAVLTGATALICGVALASACGLRAFLPLLGLSLASRAGLVQLGPHAGWIASDGALWSLAVATVVEVLGDKVPVLDHALDVIATVVRPAAAAIASWATFGAVDPRLAAIAAIVLGAGALGVHLAKAKLRLGSTALTLGHANPVLSVGEDATAAGLSAAAILVPLLALAAVLVGVAILIALRRRSR